LTSTQCSDLLEKYHVDLQKLYNLSKQKKSSRFSGPQDARLDPNFSPMLKNSSVLSEDASVKEELKNLKEKVANEDMIIKELKWVKEQLLKIESTQKAFLERQAVLDGNVDFIFRKVALICSNMEKIMSEFYVLTDQSARASQQFNQQQQQSRSFNESSSSRNQGSMRRYQ
jgi:hypothetical protein